MAQHSVNNAGHPLLQDRREERRIITRRSTYGRLQTGDVRVFGGRVSEYLPEQERVLDQPRAWDVQEAPQVQLPAEGRLQAALQEVLHTLVLLLLVQQGLGSQLVAAVHLVGVQTWELWREGTGRRVGYLHTVKW